MDQPQPEISLDDVLSRRFDLVEQIAVLAGQHKAQLAPLNDELLLCEQYIKDELNKSGAQQWKSARTGHQTFFTIKDSVTVEDFDRFVEFIDREAAWHLLNKAANKTAVKEYIETNAKPPPGVKYDTFRDLSWRRGKG